MNYLFYLYISDKYLQDKYLPKKGIDILISKTFVFIFHHSMKMKLLVILFIRKKKHLLGKIFGSPHTRNRIYLLQNCFPKYVYLKDVYITLKGKGIGKILFISVLRILLICKFLNFTAAFTEKIKPSKVYIQFSV